MIAGGWYDRLALTASELALASSCVQKAEGLLGAPLLVLVTGSTGSRQAHILITINHLIKQGVKRPVPAMTHSDQSLAFAVIPGRTDCLRAAWKSSPSEVRFQTISLSTRLLFCRAWWHGKMVAHSQRKSAHHCGVVLITGHFRSIAFGPCATEVIKGCANVCACLSGVAWHAHRVMCGILG